MRKWVYLFGKGVTEGSAKMRDLLGGKGANLAEMTLLGIPYLQVLPYQLKLVVIIIRLGANILRS